MMHVHAGTDTYGRVKAVAGTAIVTKFAMFQSLPVFPLRSYYFISHGPTERSGVPFFASSESTSIVGLPLASIDVASVLMAYLRAFFATLVVVGSIPAIMAAVTWLGGQHMADGMKMLGVISSCVLGTGIVGGLLTYAIPLASRRDRDIREYCAEILGVSADPACVTREAKVWISAFLEEHTSEEHLMETEYSRTEKILELIQTRMEIPGSDNAQALEDRTDDLLERLKADDPIAG
jgi:hypothetical protein